MRNVRISLAVTLIIGACICAPFVWAMSKEKRAKISAGCEKVFDLALDNCLGGGWTPNECLESAASSYEQCMRDHGIDKPYPTRQVTPSRAGKESATKSPPSIAPATPTPSKRKVIDTGSVTTANPGRNATATATPSKRKTIDNGSLRGVSTVKTPTPTPTPFGSPKPVPKKTSSPKPHIQRNG